jgi:RNA polymerase sigma factor (TIGR02999 family)
MRSMTGAVTEILAAMQRGDEAAAAQLYDLVYQELRAVAERKMAHEPSGQTLQPTALVHEAYLRLVEGAPDDGWQNRRHFFAAAAETMRRILVENARRRGRRKRGGHLRRSELPESELATPPDSDDLLALDEALTQLHVEEPDKAELVTLRYFAGLTLEEAAETMGVSRATASRYWTYAKAWLYDRITRSGENEFLAK